MTAFPGVSSPDLEIELADIAEKDMWLKMFHVRRPFLLKITNGKF